MKDIKHLIRAGWNAGPGLMQRLGEVWGRPMRDRAPEVKRPDDVTAGWHCEDARVRASETER